MASKMQQWRTAGAAIVLFGLCAAAAVAETLVGSNIDSRVILALKVDDAAAQKLLPESWKLLTLPKGPIAGTNLLLVFIDRHLQRDAEGKPATPYAGLSVAMVAYGVQPGVEGARTFVTRVWETPLVASSYDNGAAAMIGREATLTDGADGTRHRSELWTLSPEAGGTLTLKLDHRSGQPAWSQAEVQPYSAAKPDFHRIYRYEQLLELAMSNALGKPLDGSLTVTSDIPELSAMLDGSETVTGLMVVPVRVREVWLP